jgi:hypothetical protein
MLPSAAAAEHKKRNQYTSSLNNWNVMQTFGLDSYGVLGAAADRYLRILAYVCAYNALLASTDSQGYDLNF